MDSKKIRSAFRDLANNPRRFSKKLRVRSRQAVRKPLERRRAMRRSTYGALNVEPVFAPEPYYRTPSREVLAPHAETLFYLTGQTLAHRFDLLGSGWVEVRHGMECAGLEGHRWGPPHPALTADDGGQWIEHRINSSNRGDARSLWSQIAQPYVPIDWQLDFKSGFRWPEKLWSQDIQFGSQPGVDVKVPWELARLHHLPQLALAHACLVQGLDPTPSFDAGSLRAEFRNQVLDFLAANPPGFGVNWACPMDVAIRAVNILVARDLFLSQGVRFDDDLERVLARSIADHGWHVVQHLEWYLGHRGNHYLSDIVGLLFIALYLERSPRIDAWLAFAIQELNGEIEFQFHREGSNAEGSTAYHRLCTELAIHGSSMLLSMPARRRAGAESADPGLGPHRPRLVGPLPAGSPLLSHVAAERLAGAGEFLAAVCKPNGQMLLVGDMDSGRLLKLDPRGTFMTLGEARSRYANLGVGGGGAADELYWDEDNTDASETIAASAALLGRGDTIDRLDPPSIAGACLATMIPVAPTVTAPVVMPSSGEEAGLSSAVALAATVGPDHRRETVIPLDFDPGSGLNGAAYAEFGLYVYRSPRLLMTFRCGPTEVFGFGAHLHNDQLGLTLSVDGVDRIVDPGNYIYTPIVQRRNEYRSVFAHFAPAIEGKEPSPLDGVFRHSGSGQGTCVAFGPTGVTGWHEGYGERVHRIVVFEASGIRIIDFTEGKLALAEPGPLGGDSFSRPVKFSPGYGKRFNEDERP